MSTAIIIMILIIICFFAIKNSQSHFKGEGGCCGGGDIELSEKTLNHIMDQKKVYIKGMHCENCVKRITNAINDKSYLVCHVDLKKNIAYIDGSQMIDNNEIQDIIEKLGYQVTKIE